MGERDWEKGDCLIDYLTPPAPWYLTSRLYVRKSKPQQMTNTFIHCSQAPTSKFAVSWNLWKRKLKAQIPQFTAKDENHLKVLDFNTFSSIQILNCNSKEQIFTKSEIPLPLIGHLWHNSHSLKPFIKNSWAWYDNKYAQSDCQVW